MIQVLERSLFKFFLELGEKAVNVWYSEVKAYPEAYGEVQFDTSNGHFTQLVWKASSEVGVGVATSRSSTGMNNYFVVVDFSPCGNYEGEYAENVLQPVARF
jgi:hypothetical protein